MPVTVAAPEPAEHPVLGRLLHDFGCGPPRLQRPHTFQPPAPRTTPRGPPRARPALLTKLRRTSPPTRNRAASSASTPCTRPSSATRASFRSGTSSGPSASSAPRPSPRRSSRNRTWGSRGSSPCTSSRAPSPGRASGPSWTGSTAWCAPHAPAPPCHHHHHHPRWRNRFVPALMSRGARPPAPAPPPGGAPPHGGARPPALPREAAGRGVPPPQREGG